MARFSVACKIDGTRNGSPNLTFRRHVPDPINASGTAAAQAAAQADVDTLVADGASPTQAHVTALNTHFTTFVADIAAVPTNADVLLSYNASTVLTRSNLRRAVLELLQTVEAYNELTP